MKTRGLGVAGLLAATLFLTACQMSTTGNVETRYPDGTVSTVNFTKGVFDDLDVPAKDPATGEPAAYLRIGTSRVASNAAVEMFRYSGDSIRQYAIDRAARAQQTRPQP